MTDRERQWLRDMMIDHSLTQVQVAGLIGIGQDKMSRVMHGTRRLSLDEALRLCDTLGDGLDPVTLTRKKGDH
jgi:plasmid maintenance system antidote protein VapI